MNTNIKIKLNLLTHADCVKNENNDLQDSSRSAQTRRDCSPTMRRVGLCFWHCFNSLFSYLYYLIFEKIYPRDNNFWW